MDSTIVVAGMGFVATLGAAWLSAESQRRSARGDRLLEAKIRVYGECSAAFYDLARATFNRVRARIEGLLPDAERDSLRQEFYRANALVRTAIGQITILTRDDGLRMRLEGVRKEIGDLNSATNREELKHRHREVQASLLAALQLAREELRSDHRETWLSALRPGTGRRKADDSAGT